MQAGASLVGGHLAETNGNVLRRLCRVAYDYCNDVIDSTHLPRASGAACMRRIPTAIFICCPHAYHVSRACLQVSSWPHGTISDRRLSTGHPTPVAAGYGRLTSTHASYLGRTPGSETGALLSLVHGFGTLYQWNSVSRTLNLLHFGGY